MSEKKVENVITPKVSVVIPAYNAACFIEEAIQSVQIQEYQASEIIVVNDGSTDMDYTNLAMIHPSIRVICQRNRGVSAARNAGCMAATGDFLAFLDADDVWLPGKLAAQVSFLREHPDVAAVFTRALKWRPMDGAWRRPDFKQPFLPNSARFVCYRDFLLGIPVAAGTMVIRREIFEKIGGYEESIRHGEDINLCLRLAVSHRLAVLQNLYILYRHNSSSITNQAPGANRLAEEVMRAVRTVGLVDAFGDSITPRELRNYLADVHFAHGYTHFWHGSPVSAITECAKSFMLARRTRALVYCALSAIPGGKKIAIAIRSVQGTAPEVDEMLSQKAVVEISGGGKAS